VLTEFQLATSAYLSYMPISSIFSTQAVAVIRQVNSAISITHGIQNGLPLKLTERSTQP